MHINKAFLRKLFMLMGAAFLLFMAAFVWTRQIYFLNAWDEGITELRFEWHDLRGIEHIQTTTDPEQIADLQQFFTSIQTPKRKLAYNVDPKDGATVYKLKLRTEQGSWGYTFNEWIVLTKGEGFPGRHSF